MVQSVPWIPLFLLTGGLLLGLAWATWKRRDEPGALLFSLLMLASGIYTLFTTAQIASTTLGAKLFWLKAQYPAVMALPVLWVLFALDYTGRDRWITWRWAGTLAVVPVLAVVLAWTDPAHGLFFQNMRVEQVGGLYDLEYSFGPLGALSFGYVYLLYLVTSLVFLELVSRSNPEYRRQGVVLMLGFLIPALVAMGVMFLTGIPTDLTPFALLVSGITITYMLVYSNFLTVVPINRDAAFEELRGAVLVVDSAGTVVDMNQAGTTVFGSDAVGTPADAVLEEAGFDVTLATLSDGCVLTTGEEEDERKFEVATQSMNSRLGSNRGTIVLLYDVTDRLSLEHKLHETNDQLSVLNRVLRHDVRNHVSVIAGHADMLSSRIDDPDASLEQQGESITAIERAATHIGELTQVAGDISESLDQEEVTDHRPIDAGDTLQDAIENAKVRYPEATFEVPSSYPSVTVVANTLLSSVFTNLLNNAVQHNDTDEPTVEVAVTTTEDVFQVRIADDGPGIPDGQKERIFGRGERGLDSGGSGLGLYLVERLLDDYSGTITVSDNEPRGSVFELELPVVAETEQPTATVE